MRDDSTFSAEDVFGESLVVPEKYLDRHPGIIDDLESSVDGRQSFHLIPAQGPAVQVEVFVNPGSSYALRNYAGPSQQAPHKSFSTVSALQHLS